MRRFFVFAAVLAIAGLATAGAPPAPDFQDFETDTGDWSGAVRVPSGTDGVPSADGSFHAQTTGGYTLFGGYSSEWPEGGFVTSIDIYLDATAYSTNDLRFEWTCAVSRQTGAHLQDFVFNMGFYTGLGETGTESGFVFSASNNSYGWPQNPGRDPVESLESGWYTLRHDFYDDGGVLACDMQVIAPSGSLVGTWTLKEPANDIATTVGGNRYGWFPQNNLGALAIDNLFRSGAATPPQTAIEELAAELDAMLPTGDKETDKRLEKASKELEKAAEDKNWTDEETPDGKDGKKVFDKLEKAVHELMKIDDSTAEAAIADLVAVAQGLAEDALALVAESDDKHAEKAASEYQKALEEIEKGKFDKAVEKFGKAFEEAQKALEKDKK